MQNSPTTSLWLLVKGIRQVAQEINDLAPQSKARNNIVYPSHGELDELLDLSDSIHFYDDLAHGILKGDSTEAISDLADRNIGKLFDQYYEFGKSSFSFPKMEYRSKFPYTVDFGNTTQYLLEKITFDRATQQLPPHQVEKGFKFDKRIFENLKRERHTVHTFDPTPIQNQTINREAAVIDLMDGLRSLKRCADRADIYWTHVENPQVLMEMNFAKEFAQLILATSNIASEIRLYSSYVGEQSWGHGKYIHSNSLPEIHDLSNAIMIATEILDVFHQDSVGVLINKVLELKQQLSHYYEFTPTNAFAYSHIRNRHYPALVFDEEIRELPINSFTAMYRHNFEVDTMPEVLKNMIERTKISMDKVECLRDTTFTINRNSTRFHLVEALIVALDGFIQKVGTVNAA